MAVLRIHFTDADLARTRVARDPDPLWETVLGLYRLANDDVPVFEPWRNRARLAVVERGAQAQVRMVRQLVPREGYFPDFLTPAEGRHGVAAGLEAVRGTPSLRLLGDIAYAARSRPLPAWAHRVARSDRDALDELVSALKGVHDVLVRPAWEDAQAAVAAERAALGRTILDAGVDAALETLRPTLRWNPPVLEADYPKPLDVRLGGRGALLVPSYFCWGNPVALVDPALPPVIVYPVRHPANWTPDRSRSLGALLGRTRAAVLAALTGTATTTELAARLRLSPASASEHVGVLRDSGLVVSRREGRTVLHSLTPLAQSLLEGRRA
ncbi:putative transcriptional regulator, ArsR family [Actinosynnema mirum DSM 43827]|uniref:Putative transcriptional regulator, ArsR family n=1 Tax=Actinosynnema mirum (strain ATCC 29888 / DSM 43827 / JCM 3225 / NBRC 14064 / NCIMB 13271 / NRRL B-12336 / IMRU 3971 / 101) TaxID=446462 RepID=C6WGM5_ACTMD|nr:putative transcriptional regulator, ArsR family [Actinosynnema mirum DSM 43827]